MRLLLCQLQVLAAAAGPPGRALGAKLPHLSSAAGFVKVGHRPLGQDLVIAGIGSGAFDPAKLSSWNYDERFPLLEAKPGGRCPDAHGNVYNANCINNGETDWNCFYGGWDGVDSCHDSVSVSVTNDAFKTMGTHTPVVATGSMIHVNNPSATKLEAAGGAEWLMAYTQDKPQDGGQVNKPGISWSSDGVNFVPNAGGESFITVKGYPHNWTRADVNGGNVLLEVNGTLHLYFIDFKEGLHGVFRASAPFQPAAHAARMGGSNRTTVRMAPPPTEFAYEGVALSEAGRIVNDLKLVNGYYLLGAHCNGQSVYYSASTTPDRFPPTKKLFSHLNSADEHMVSLGFVIDHTATRVLGALYGAGATSALDNNRVFAAWLQRHVLFVGTDGGVVWGLGDADRALGPDAVSMATNRKELRGKFMLYDTDYVNATARG
jgi:hypothetical protein